ncbi:MAG: MFS transporter [Rhodospirillales bacterium]|nr:MFS transporter [Rhodospirillales bacterium]MSP79608.1 MFS transporter [Rhodospirillales bacterium]
MSGAGAARLPAGVWALGFVSLLMDLSSEIIHSLLPIFMVGTLGAGVFALGLIEGVAEGAASIVKVFSGWFSDRIGRRKPLALAGYGIAALTKPLFALAPTLGWVFAARLADRLGKGIRGAPRDALVADLTAPAQRGAAFGLRQSLDTVGALIAPIAAVGLMVLFAGDVRAVFWVAVIPAVAAVAVLALCVREPARHAAQPEPLPLSFRAALHPAALGGAFWKVTAVAAVLTLARFGEAFLVLRGLDMGFGPSFAPLVMAAMAAAYAASAYPAGALSDRLGRARLLALGIALLIVADLVFAFGAGRAAALVGAVLWGLHMGLTQGLFAAMVADAAPAHLRGSAFGVFHLIGGILTFAASALAGGLWQFFGAPAAFLAGAAFAVLALIGLRIAR